MVNKENSTASNYINVKAVVTVKLTLGGFLKNLGLGQALDNISDFLRGNALHLELVSKDLDPRTPGFEKQPLKAQARKEFGLNLLTGQDLEETQYEAHFNIPKNFGEIGAVLVSNEHQKEMFLKNIVLEYPSSDNLGGDKLRIDCESWIASKHDNPEKRIFFTHKSYLPSQTPAGLKMLRVRELEILRGNGKGERKTFDRIYDYDTYNDLGNPDSDVELKRPVLGGKDFPYPRRCRTGRPKCKKDPLSESKSGTVYVPRDENFADIKELSFGINLLTSVLHALIPTLEATIVDKDMGFDSFNDVKDLYKVGVELPPLHDQKNMRADLPGLLENLNDTGKDVLLFETPDLINRDAYAWLRDAEFARETLAGINPYGIQLVKEWPLVSKLDPNVYGSPKSAITAQLIEQEIKEDVQEVITQKKLYILDFHDLLLPYVNKVNKIKGTVLYGSRTIFHLTTQGTLKPLAIELVRPPSDNKPQWKRVYTPGGDGTTSWLWRLAKAHVLAHDSAHHELVSHWLRTHCCTEPYVIATNRQLSAMHPIYRLLDPHFRYTMEINALARQALINADGIIETTFSAQKYSMEFSSAVYAQQWRFDLQALPADLISRGMAEEDPSSPNGLKLSIEDYPFAADGLLLWDAIKQWVTDYVNHYYPQPNLIQSDTELHSWWSEIRTLGHGDKKDEPWWPQLNTNSDLIQILTTMIWVSSGHHAAVNFGQYAYAGYFPNRPTIARSKMPDEDPTEDEWRKFVDRPEQALLTSFPSKIQATKVMAVLEVLSTHSPDEEYIGDRIEPSWACDQVLDDAFKRFHGKLKKIEEVIDRRNKDDSLKNRYGAGTLPYEILKPYSKPGVTGMGVPNSISI